MVLPELSLKILEAIKAHGALRMGSICPMVEANRNTVKVHLRNLVKNGYLKKTGVGKGTVYSV